MDLYKKIKELLKQKGKSMQDLELSCGLSKGYVSKFKTITPRADTINKIAKYLEVSVECLYGAESITYEEETHTWQQDDAEQPNGYYLYEQTRTITDFLMHNPEYSVLFDASRKVKPEDIEKAIKILGILSEN